MTALPSDYVPLSGSSLSPVAGFVPARTDLDPKRELAVSVALRRRTDAIGRISLLRQLQQPGGARDFLSADAFLDLLGAAPDDLEAVEAFARKAGLTVVEESGGRAAVLRGRNLRLSGSAAALEAAFGVRLRCYQGSIRGRPTCYIGREGPVFVPAALQGVVQGVFGLDERPIGGRSTPLSFTARPGLPTPPEVAALYNFPAVPATGQRIVLLEFGGGYFRYDLERYFASIGMAVPAIEVVELGGAYNAPGHDVTSDCEVTLDMCIAGSVAPQATLVVCFAPLTEDGWTTALKHCIEHCNPSVISISWGAGELERSDGLHWSRDGIAELRRTFVDAAAKGIAVVAASGDDGSDARVGDRLAHVAYPASDEFVVGCGGSVIADFAHDPGREVPWTRSGGGISRLIDAPCWQTDNVKLPSSVATGQVKRGVPDICGYAAPGFEFLYRRLPFVASGTSLTAPLYAALLARLGAALARPLGALHRDLYGLAGSPVFRDMQGGPSNSFAGAAGYHPGPGWDAVTGLGVIDGARLLAALRPPP